MVNKSLLAMLVRRFGAGNVEVYATRSTMNLYKSMPEASGIKRCHTLWVNSWPGHWAMLLRYISSALYNILILLFSRKGDVLFYNFDNVFAVRTLNWLNRFKHCTVITCCHAEMEYLSNADRHTRLYKKLMTALTCGFFANGKVKPSPGMHFIVLGDVILDNLRPLISDAMYARFASVDHPVEDTQSDNVNQQSESTGKKVHIGSVGIMNYYKGSDLLCRILAENKFPRVEFSIVGQIQDHLDDFRNLGVTIPENPQEALNEEDFKRGVESLDFILLTYPTDNYRLIASGAFLDTLRYAKPLIALRTDYFEYMFRKYGAVGYLADDEQHLVELLQKAPELNRQFPFAEIRRRLTAEALHPQFDAAMDMFLSPQL